MKDTPMVKRVIGTAMATFGADYRKDPFGLLLWITLALTVGMGLFGRHVTWEVHAIIAALTLVKGYIWFVTEGYQKPIFAKISKK